MYLMLTSHRPRSIHSQAKLRLHLHGKIYYLDISRYRTGPVKHSQSTFSTNCTISPGPQRPSFNELAPLFKVSGLWQNETPNVMSRQVDTVWHYIQLLVHEMGDEEEGRRWQWWWWWCGPAPDLWSHNNFPLLAAAAWRGWRRRGEWRIPGI